MSNVGDEFDFEDPGFQVVPDPPVRLPANEPIVKLMGQPTVHEAILYDERGQKLNYTPVGEQSENIYYEPPEQSVWSGEPVPGTGVPALGPAADEGPVPIYGPPAPTGPPAPRPAVAGGGGYAPIRERQYYYPPDYEQRLAKEYGDEGLNRRWDERMAAAYRDRFSGKISEQEFAKAKSAADAAREAEKGEGAKQLQAYRDWQGTSMGMQTDIVRQQFGMADRQAQAQHDVLGRQQYASQMQAGAQQRMQREQQAARDERVQQEAEHQAAYEREFGKYQQEVDDLAKAKVDPDRYWKTGGPLRAVMSIIGAGLLGAAGKPEVALQSIQAGIQNDLAAQRADLETKKAGVAARNSILGRMRERYGDIERAEQAAYAWGMRKYANRVRLYASKADSETKSIQMNLVADQMDAQAKLREDQLHLQAKQLAEQEALMRARMRAGAVAQRQRAAELQQQGYELSGNDLKRYIPDVGLALPGSDVKELRNASADLVGKQRLIRQAQGLLSLAAGGTVLSPTQKKLLLQVQSQLQAPEIKKIAGASMTDQEMEKILPGIGGDFTSYTSRNYGDAQKVLSNYERHLKNQQREMFGAHTEPGQATQAIDPKTGRRTVRFKPQLTHGGGTAEIRPPGQ